MDILNQANNDGFIDNWETTFSFEESMDYYLKFCASDDIMYSDFDYFIKMSIDGHVLNESTNLNYSPILNHLIKQSLMLSKYRGKYVSEPSVVCGVYAIYKDNECLYVGQSTNLGKRIFQHVTETERYSYFDKIICWIAEANLECHQWYRDLGSDCLFTPSKSHKEILEKNEDYLIHILNPKDNIIRNKIDLSFENIFINFARAVNTKNAQKLKECPDFSIERSGVNFLINGGLKPITRKSKYLTRAQHD